MKHVRNLFVTLHKCRELIQYAKKSLDWTNYYYGIEACNEILDGCGHIIGPAMKHECLCTRAALLLKQKWKNDAHMAIRDCYNAMKIDNSSYKALYHMSEALSQFGRHKEALDFAITAHLSAPSISEVAERVKHVQKDIDSSFAKIKSEAKKHKTSKDEGSRFEGRGRRILSLGDIIYHPQAYSEFSQDSPGSEGDDSNYEEELELDLETSMSGDDGRDVESDNLHGSLNLRTHQRGDSHVNASANGSCESPSSSSSQNNRASYQVITDMEKLKQDYQELLDEAHHHLT